ncbi:MAG TPA: glutathione S-transferase family protein [Caulobacteraceae bacterium]|nr:glutathione S-transferase family protein [Caulobacteraceae bacterium]
MADGLVLYCAPATRSVSALWLLEELGAPYRIETVDRRAPEYLVTDPRGRVPLLVDGQTKVAETSAICLYLADRYGYGTLAPKLEDPARGPHMSWTVWATSVLEPASALDGHDIPPKRPGAWHFGFGKLERELAVLEAGLARSDYLAGNRFTAADVMVGSVVRMRLFTGELPRRPLLLAYVERLAARPAYERAVSINWPPEQFGNG